MRRSIILSSLAFGALSAVAAGPASADPKSDETIPVTCDNGQSYEVVTNGNGDYTPGHIVGSTATLVPVAFGEFTGSVTFPNGDVETFTEPGSAKGNSGKNRTLLTCTFSFLEVGDGSDPEFPAGAVFRGSGSVIGFFTPAR